MSRAERLERKRIAARERYQRIKNDPVRCKELKEKERQSYARKKKMGLIKMAKEMTIEELLKARKRWREKTRKFRARRKI
ncbi:unnamed protein product [Leptosia nina]|uniref:Uncharacterized protein n=1 Tax=Leptosia nina TaxID=320188 RepID=A0AAV1J392_9NEOP